MKADKKLSIKVKSKTERRIMESPQMEVIIKWNIKRIFIALLVLLLLVIIPSYYLNSQNEDPALKDIKQPVVTTETIILTPKTEVSVIKPDIVEVIKPLKGEVIKSKNTQLKKDTLLPEKIKPVAQMPAKAVSEQLHLNISRARLAKGMKDKEPYGDIELPVLVNSERAVGLFYFTEINNMKGETVFHEWLKEGESIYKRKIKIRGNRWRVSTNKLFNN